MAQPPTRAPLRSVTGRLAGSAALLSLSAASVSLATFISIPIILGVLGAQLWVSIAVGQALGELARVVIIWGWNSIGLTVVSSLDPRERLTYYFTSLPPRLLLLAAAGGAAAVTAATIPTQDRAAAAVMAFAASIYGLSGGWVFIGGKEPLMMVLCDAVPRALSIVAAAMAVLLFRTPLAFPLTTVVGTTLAVLVPFVVLRRRAARADVPFAPDVRGIPRRLKEGWPAFVSAFVLSLRLLGPVILAPVIVPAASAAVALGDKFLRWGNTAMTPFMQTLQVHIPKGAGTLERRITRGIGAAWAMGLALGAAVALVVPPVSGLLSHGEIHLPHTLSIPLGVVVLSIFVSAITGNSALVLIGRVRQVMASAICGLAVMAVTFPLMAGRWGATGAFWGLAMAEVAVMVWQFTAVAIALRGKAS